MTTIALKGPGPWTVTGDKRFPVTTCDNSSRTHVTSVTDVTGKEGEPGRGLNAVGGGSPSRGDVTEGDVTERDDSRGRTCDACAGTGWLWVNCLRRLASCPLCQGGGARTVADLPKPETPRPVRPPKPSRPAKPPAIPPRDLVFGHYGRAAENLAIDHVFGGGKSHLGWLRITGRGELYQWLIRNEFPAGFQTLCKPCNSSKGEGKRCRRWHPRESRGEAG